MTNSPFRAGNRSSLLLAILLPPLLLLSYVAVLRLVGIGSLGPVVDILVQLAALYLGYSMLTRRYEHGIWAALLYFPMMFVLTWGIAFMVTGWLRWYEY